LPAIWQLMRNGARPDKAGRTNIMPIETIGERS
jgi:hypothetical protein